MILTQDQQDLAPVLQSGKKVGKIITTVEAFYKDPELLYWFLKQAANMGVDVHMAKIKTTDKENLL